MKDEFTTAMHAEWLSSEMCETDVKICGVFGAMARGLTKKEALQKYQIDEDYYDQNIDRVLNS